MRKTYAILASVAQPFIWLWLKNRSMKGKEDTLRLRERFGHLSISRPEGKVVWIHAASVGEANSVMPLLRKLHDADESIHIVMTTGTVTSAKLMAGRLPARAYHQFVPVDVPSVVRRFLKQLQPDVAIWVESEFWPNLLAQTNARGIPIYLVNARISERSMNRWMWARGFFAAMIEQFSAVYAGSQIDKQRLHQLGASKVQWAGNLKYDTDILSADSKETSTILQKIGDRRIWLASSTHAGEEEIIAEVHKNVREVFPDLLTIIVPRHPHRSDAISELLSLQKLTVTVRSKQQPILPETDVYLADTMGELGIFYRLAGVVFIGGSLVPHGGHNPIEAAQLDCAMLSGKHMQSFTNISLALREAQALVEVQDGEALSEHVTQLLRDHDAQETMAARAHAAVDDKRGAATAIADVVLKELGMELTQETEAELQGETL